VQSPDGSILLPGTGGSLVTADGVWTFDTAMASGGNVILLNGWQTADGSAASLLVARGGKRFAHSANGRSYEWVGSWQELSGDSTCQ
jgi:hypothetical protein